VILLLELGIKVFVSLFLAYKPQRHGE